MIIITIHRMQYVIQQKAFEPGNEIFRLTRDFRRIRVRFELIFAAEHIHRNRRQFADRFVQEHEEHETAVNGYIGHAKRIKQTTIFHKQSQQEEQQSHLQDAENQRLEDVLLLICLLYTSPSPRDATLSRMPSSA